MRKILGAASALSLGLMLAFATPAAADPKFEAFVQSLWPRVKAAGFSRQLFDAAFAGVTDPDPLVLKLAGSQPEFTSTTSEYLAKAVTPARIQTGQTAVANDGALLAAIEKKYGVSRYALLGIWGIESNFGKDLGSMSVMRSLATLIYSGRKTQYANEQLIAAFRILQKGIRKPDHFTGSWAAAMGHTQFIPTSYLSYAQDWTGDGQKDIWGSKEDALASTAHYLAKSGWKNDRPWGFEVKLPKGFNRALIGRKTWKTIGDWQKLGLARADGAAMSSLQAKAFVMIPQGIDGPAFLVTQNFLAVYAYNQSHSYALAVCHLGDRIRGAQNFVGAWPAQDMDLSFKERVELQRRLTSSGFDTGGDDGRFGARTYEAVIAFQKKAGLQLDGRPNRKVLERLRQGL
ncbi:MAG: lytic murein transglycosylase [Hyphomicrobiales bacterium]